jgi:putative copper resistance protein D
MGVVLVWVHVLAAVVWIGGMVFLSLVLVPILKREPFAAQRGALIRTAALRFRLVVWIAIAVLLVTGPLLVMSRGWSPGEPAGWPSVLIVKLILIAILLLLTFAHDLFIGPRVGRILQVPEPSRSGHDRLLVASSSWLPRLSLLLALAVLFAAVSLARM